MIVRLHWQANFILRNLGCFENFVKFELYYGKVVANNWLFVWSQHFICVISRLNRPAILTIKKLRILSTVSYCRIAGCAVGAFHADTESVHQNTEEALPDHARCILPTNTVYKHFQFLDQPRLIIKVLINNCYKPTTLKIGA